MKYFNFLLENDINFKIDETGNYTALVKVFNPEYFKEKEKAKNNPNKNNFQEEIVEAKNDPRYFRSNSTKGKRNFNKEQSILKNEKDNIFNKKVFLNLKINE